MISPEDTWKDFKTAFCTALDEAEKAHLLTAWETTSNRTTFYYSTFMPSLAARLGYQLQPELHRCDYAFLNSAGVPIIYLESENAHTTAAHEIKSLCCLAAPLKVLAISCEWKTSEKERFLPKWSEIIRTHHEVISLDCLYVIIVGEWRGTEECLIEYSFTVIDGDGSTRETEFHPITPSLNRFS